DGIGPVDHGRLDKFFENPTAIAMVVNVAFGSFQAFEKSGLEVFVEEVAAELKRAPCILDDLDRFDAGEFVKEPAAACEHEHRMQLQFEELEHNDLFGLAQWT